MYKAGIGSILTLVAVFIFCTCIDPFTPEIKGYESLLVVEGLVTDEDAPYQVKLSRTMVSQDAIPEKISDAEVSITSEAGERADLIPCGDGIYQTDRSLFRGTVGDIYTLHILTSDGKEYKSEQCILEPVTEIDSIYTGSHQEIPENGNEIISGIMIYLDSKAGQEKYYRWDFEETWKFRVPNPKKFNYISDTLILPVKKINEYCWKTVRSDAIIIRSVHRGEPEFIEKEPLAFLPTGKSDRFRLQYSILVKQYSISKKEYDFWDNMKKVNDSGGDIFAKQPYPVISNVYNVNDPDEKVLGYFQVSAVREKRIYILPWQIDIELPRYNYPCKRLEYAPEDFPPSSPWSPPLTWNGLYKMFCVTNHYAFVEPIYINGFSPPLKKLVFSDPECADCELTGFSQKPDFWIDMN